MKLGYQLNMTQTQKLIMTPELRQAINVLQLSTIELTNFIQDQLLENPLLEMAEESAGNVEVNYDDNEQFDIDWQEYFADKSDIGYSKEVKEVVPFENYLSKVPSLPEYLDEQLSYLQLDEEKLALAQFVIGNIDKWGYCTFDVQETAQDLGITPAKLEEAVAIIQTLEPEGIGARNLGECLTIQLKKRNKLTPLLKQIIDNYLNDIGKGKISKVANSLGITISELQENIDILKTLNPKPGSGFGTNQDTRFIVPDIIVEKIDDEYIVLVNDISSSRLTVNDLYKEILNSENADKVTKTFVERKLHGAIWLIKSIEQRRITLYKIANALVSLQREFLDKGSKHLVPLNLKDVAEQVGVHESTVSRAIADKYVQTTRGLYPLKYFFSSGVKSKMGEKVSSQVIKKSIEDIVGDEDATSPLSDQKICDLLQENGIKIARRTVSKYREELGILSAAQRKRY